ncbi:cation efflux protein [Pilobolus umbonatus]|nr:cation efflux protein [Pilobolus umbonatus]
MSDSERSPLINKNNKYRSAGSVVTYTVSNSHCTNTTKANVAAAKQTKVKLWFAVCLAFLFFATELVAGYFANSLALMSDAFHLLSDVASFIVALVAIYLAEKPPTKTHTFGFHRAEVIAALISVLTIWLLTGFLVREAILRIQSPQEINARLMCMTASIGVVVNLILAYVLGGHHHHSHDETHVTIDVEDPSSQPLPVRKETNINLRAAALHVLGDLLASVGVLISSVVLIFNPTYTFVDPLCTFFFSILVLYTTYHLVKDSIAVLMEGVPGSLHPDVIKQSLLDLPGVMAVHDLHVWTLSPGKYSLTAHIIIDDEHVDYDNILDKGQHIVCDMYGIHHSTLQIETGRSLFTSHCNPQLCASGTD